MTIYTCQKCNRSFDRKSTYDYHVYERKRSCVKDENVDIDIDNNPSIFQCELCTKTFTCKRNLLRHSNKACPFKPDIGTEITTTEHEDKLEMPEQVVSEQEINTDSPKKEYICTYCTKSFTRKDNMIRHAEYFCIMKTVPGDEKVNSQQIAKKLEEHTKIIEELKKEMMAGKNINCNNSNNNNSTTVNNNTQNNNYNVKLVAFGKEDMFAISDQICKTILKRGYQSVPQLIEHVHFNKDIPEQQNVYIPNMRDIYAMTFDGENWNLTDRDEVINQLLDDKHVFLIAKYKELKKKLDVRTDKKFKTFNDDKDDHVNVNLKKQVKLMLYNKRHMPLKTKKSTNNILP